MELLLYQYESCPYCRKVSRFIQKEGISLPMKDTLKDKSAREELRRIGGKTQVPCLVIDGSALYESDDIIAWLRERSEQLKPAKV